jgi:hypothetical protein
MKDKKIMKKKIKEEDIEEISFRLEEGRQIYRIYGGYRTIKSWRFHEPVSILS